MDITDHEACYGAVRSRDRRFDGMFYTGVRTTGIYCRPSCPAVTPRRRNVDFYPSAAAAQAAGLRACRRCLPDATPGSPEWDLHADVAGRAMRLIADGVVEREGIDGLAGRLGYSTRQLNRLVTAHWGAGPLALARSRRAQTARVLIETTDWGMADIAFAAGFASVRQFNDTVREVYAAAPTQLRQRSRGAVSAPGTVTVRLAVREPFAADRLLGYLAARAVAGVERIDATTYERTLRLPHGPARMALDLSGRAPLECRLTLTDQRDLAPAIERARRLVDADADPLAVTDALGDDPLIGALVRDVPGRRVPGHVDGFEVAVRAVVGQQVSVAGAATTVGRLVARFGRPVEDGVLFPTAAALAAADPDALGMPRSRGRALVGLAAAVAAGRVRLDRSADRADTRAALVALPGIGPWTAGYVALRALGDPDVLLPADAGVRHAADRLGVPLDALVAASERWRPWRSYAQVHLWGALERPATTPATTTARPTGGD